MGALTPLAGAGLATAGTLVLLGAFHQTVSHSVNQAEARRHAEAQRATAQWRCGLLPSLTERRGCLGKLGAAALAAGPACERTTPDGSACMFGVGTHRSARAAAAQPL